MIDDGSPGGWYLCSPLIGIKNIESIYKDQLDWFNNFPLLPDMEDIELIVTNPPSPWLNRNSNC